MRIVLFAPHYAEYSIRLAIALSKTNDVLLVCDYNNCLNEVGSDLLQDAKRSLTIFSFRSDSRLRRRTSRIIVFLRVLFFRPDILHIQEQPDYLTALIARSFRFLYPIVLTIHDPKPHSGRDAIYAMRWNRFRQIIRRSAAVHHVHGAYCAEQLALSDSAKRPIVVSLHGVILVPNQKTFSKPKRILFFGRMEAYKGLDILLGAILELSRSGVDFELVLAGRGPELDRLFNEFSSSNNVKILNRYLSPVEAVSEFQKCRFVVVPYHEATQSGVVAGAFANERPVVASKVGGLVDVVRDGWNGILVNPGDSLELATAIKRLLSDENFHNLLCQGARETAKNDLNWDKIADLLNKTYVGVQARR